MLGSRGWAALESPSWGGAGDLGGRRGRFPCTGQCLKHQRCSKWGAWAEAAALLGVLELLLSSWAPQPAAPALQLPSISTGVTGAGWHLPGDAQHCSAWCACHKASVTGRVLQRGEVATWDGLGAGGCCPVPELGTRWGQRCCRHELCRQHEAERSWLCCWLCPGSAGHVGTQLVLIKGLSARREDVAVIRAGGEGCFALCGSTSGNLPWQQPLLPPMARGRDGALEGLGWGFPEKSFRSLLLSPAVAQVWVFLLIGSRIVTNFQIMVL